MQAPRYDAGMSFFAIVFALLLEQVRPLSSGNLVHAGVRSWVRWCSRNFDAGRAHHGWVVWGLAVGLPTLATFAIHVVLIEFAGWPLAPLWSASL